MSEERINFADPLTKPEEFFVGGGCSEIIFSSNLAFAPALSEVFREFLPSDKVFAAIAFTANRGMVRETKLSLSKALNEFPASTKYLVSSDKNFRIYDSPRDSISLLRLPSSLQYSSHEKLDQEFIDHVRDVGIGFGHEGVAYLSTLITQLSDCQLISTSRQDRLRRANIGI